jgi:hypothetical protein
VLNLISHIKGRGQVEGVREYGVEENMSSCEEVQEVRENFIIRGVPACNPERILLFFCLFVCLPDVPTIVVVFSQPGSGL